jgi:hypothetical protein
MNEQDTDGLKRRIAAMPNDEVLKIVDDRDGWKSQVYEAALAEAKARNILDRVSMPEGLSPAEAVARGITQTPEQVLAEVWIDLGLLKSMESIRDKLVLKGLSEAVAKESIKQVAAEKAVAEIQAAEAAYKKNVAVCLIGAGVTIVTFAMASGGGMYVVAWGAILFGGFRAYEANAHAHKWRGIREAAEKYASDA